jgi:hypothetical protein
VTSTVQKDEAASVVESAHTGVKRHTAVVKDTYTGQLKVADIDDLATESMVDDVPHEAGMAAATVEHGVVAHRPCGQTRSPTVLSTAHSTSELDVGEPVKSYAIMFVRVLE